MIGIYQITCTVNGKRYIGQSINIERRKFEHKTHSSNRYLGQDIEKYGLEFFIFDVLEECSEADLNAKENEYIANLKPEYNILGEGHTLPSNIRAQISNSVRKVWQSKIIENQLIGKRFENGHEVPENVRAKLKNAATGKIQSAETKSKRSKSMQIAMLGNRNGNKSVRCIETNSVYDSLKAAAEDLNISVTGISHVLNGRQKSVGGYHFEYSSSVETSRDECSGVGEKMSYSPKCTATKVEEIVRAVEMVNLQN